MNTEMLTNLSKFAPAAAASGAEFTTYNQDVYGMVPKSDGRYDIASLTRQEYQRDPFAFGDVATGASIGTTIAPGIGTAIGAGVGALVAGGKQLVQNHHKRKFEEKRGRMIQAAAARNSIIDKRRMVIDNLGTNISRQYMDFYG